MQRGQEAVDRPGGAKKKSAGEEQSAEFLAFISEPSYPCLGAKASINAGSFSLSVYDQLASPETTEVFARDLSDFVQSEMARTHDYATFIAIFREPCALDEEQFEQLLWSQLQLLHQMDALKNSWDPKVSSNPKDSLFSFSFAGQALYVVGMHSGSSRQSRRFRWPTLIFNPHKQFERLRANGQWARLRDTIRARDIALQGHSNPMLSDFGERSEAAQYSGRATSSEWSPPFHPTGTTGAKAKGCPFAH